MNSEQIIPVIADNDSAPPKKVINLKPPSSQALKKVKYRVTANKTHVMKKMTQTKMDSFLFPRLATDGGAVQEDEAEVVILEENGKVIASQTSICELEEPLIFVGAASNILILENKTEAVLAAVQPKALSDGIGFIVEPAKVGPALIPKLKISSNVQNAGKPTPVLDRKKITAQRKLKNNADVEKTFKCSKCAESFKRNDQMKRHMKEHEVADNTIPKLTRKRPAEALGHDPQYQLEPVVEHEAQKLNVKGGIDGSFSTEFSSSTLELEIGQQRSTIMGPESIIDMLDMTNGSNRHYCSLCPLSFLGNESLVRHVTTTHSGKKSFQCQDCLKFFARSDNLKDHMRMHTGEKPYQCQVCLKSFTRSSNLKVHMLTHTGEKLHQCQECLKSFAQSNNLKDHMRMHTGEKPYQCQVCLKSFTRSNNLKDHIKTHTGEKPHQCQECLKSFARSDTLANHMLTHTGEKPHQCQECLESFARSDTLANHMKTHSGEKPYQCQDCLKSFAQSYTLVCHIRTHTGLKPYECIECNREFRTSSSLDRHYRIHSGETPYECEDCDYATGNFSTFSMHLMTHTKEKPFECPFCENLFARSGHLDAHLRVIHLSEKKNRCPECMYVCSSAEILKRHRRMHKILKGNDPEDIPDQEADEIQKIRRESIIPYLIVPPKKGTRSCGKPCSLCPYILNRTTIVAADGSIQPSLGWFNCETKCVIYIFHCLRCPTVKYVGSTSRNAKERGIEHLRGIAKEEKKAFYNHFQKSNGHSEEDLLFEILEEADEDNVIRLAQEQDWIEKFDSVRYGLNMICSKAN